MQFSQYNGKSKFHYFFKNNQTPNIFDVICWMYQDFSFEGVPTDEELLSLFCKDTSLGIETLQSLFDMSKRDFTFSDSKFSHESKIQKIEELYGAVDNNNAIKCSGSYIVADAGAFQRAPFTQTLYASTENFKCLMITSSAPDIFYPGNFGKKPLPNSNIEPLQVIYYGAPGTGKSHQTDKLVEGDKQNKIHQRTTFHPDSDYSSFVGCYKPSKENGELTYKFVPQAFLKAYVAAWKNLQQPYYLIIEEINRGNCAQIFGDIFQLLDRRDDGFSKYHITSDTDIEAYLRDEAFVGVSADELPAIDDINTEQILSGEIMQLPSNLHIYATMNTSDQSLFPIDSAFKRRWEWEYKPIEQPKDAQFCGWKIVTDDNAAYDWWKFLTEVNNRIFDTTQSEDKKMGYWFTKADAQKRITQKKFIGKVLFYLWNDIFKDYARTESTVFKVFKDADKRETEEYTFTDFFSSEGVNERVHRLMFTLGIERETWVEPEEYETSIDSYAATKHWESFREELKRLPISDIVNVDSYRLPQAYFYEHSLTQSKDICSTKVIARIAPIRNDSHVCFYMEPNNNPNALQYIENNKAIIESNLVEMFPNDEVVVNVRDKHTDIGVKFIGIDPIKQAKIFDKLYTYGIKLFSNNEVVD